MGQLTCFVVFCHILSEASARLPMMSLSKLELRQLVGKTSRSATLSEIPHWHHLGQLPQLPPQSRCPLVPLCCLAQEHPTNNSGEKKNTCYSEHDSLPQRVPFRICSSSSCVVTPPGLEIYSRSLLEAQSHYFYSFLRITISSHQVWLMKNPLIWPYLLCFSVELPFQGFKIRLVAVAAFPVAS